VGHPLEAFNGLDQSLAVSACRTLGLVSLTGPALRAVLVHPDGSTLTLGSARQPGILTESDWISLQQAPTGSLVSAQRSSPGSLLCQVLPGIWRRVDDGLATDLMVVLVPPTVLAEALASPASEPPEGVRVASLADVNPEAEVSGGEVFLRSACSGSGSALFLRWGPVASLSPGLTLPALSAMLATATRLEIELTGSF
jgi:hypothetical protein